MKQSLTLSALALALALPATAALAQDQKQSFPIPLSRPGEPISMEIDILNGEIHVIGENRDDVLLEVSGEGSGRRIVTPSGPKTIPGGALQLEIEEYDNEIEIDSDWRNSKVVVRARVPHQAQLSLSTVHDGVIVVENIEGDLELDNVHGSITARAITGTIVAETVHGEIHAELVAVPEGRPMVMETLHGDIELKLPERYGAQLHIQSAAEEVYTDFEVELLPYEPMMNRNESGRFVIDMNQEIVATINGGGPQIRLETRYGNVKVLKAGG